jgi:hypothetical protein
MDDLTALLASFSGRFYQLRSKHNQRRLLDAAGQRLGGSRAREDQQQPRRPIGAPPRLPGAGAHRRTRRTRSRHVPTPRHLSSMPQL